jgi:hypothetical protein
MYSDSLSPPDNDETQKSRKGKGKNQTWFQIQKANQMLTRRLKLETESVGIVVRADGDGVVVAGRLDDLAQAAQVDTQAQVAVAAVGVKAGSTQEHVDESDVGVVLEWGATRVRRLV